VSHTAPAVLKGHKKTIPASQNRRINRAHTRQNDLPTHPLATTILFSASRLRQSERRQQTKQSNNNNNNKSPRDVGYIHTKGCDSLSLSIIIIFDLRVTFSSCRSIQSRRTTKHISVFFLFHTDLFCWIYLLFFVDSFPSNEKQQPCCCCNNNACARVLFG
jgi:hypothetical protein